MLQPRKFEVNTRRTTRPASPASSSSSTGLTLFSKLPKAALCSLAVVFALIAFFSVTDLVMLVKVEPKDSSSLQSISVSSDQTIKINTSTIARMMSNHSISDMRNRSQSEHIDMHSSLLKNDSNHHYHHSANDTSLMKQLLNLSDHSSHHSGISMFLQTQNIEAKPIYKSVRRNKSKKRRRPPRSKKSSTLKNTMSNQKSKQKMKRGVPSKKSDLSSLTMEITTNQQKKKGSKKQSGMSIKSDDYNTRLMNADGWSDQTMIVSAHVPLKQSLAEVGEINHGMYANLHGYSYVSIHEFNERYLTDFDFLTHNDFFRNMANNFDARMPAHFSKIRMIYWLLRKSDKYSRFLWIDSDALFMECSMTIDRVIQQTQKMYQSMDDDTQNSVDLIFTREPFTAVNSGVFLVKKSDFSVRFLEEWIKLGMIFTRPWLTNRKGHHSNRATQMQKKNMKMQQNNFKPPQTSGKRNNNNKVWRKLTNFNDQSILYMLLNGLTFEMILKKLKSYPFGSKLIRHLEYGLMMEDSDNDNDNDNDSEFIDHSRYAGKIKNPKNNQIFHGTYYDYLILVLSKYVDEYDTPAAKCNRQWSHLDVFKHLVSAKMKKHVRIIPGRMMNSNQRVYQTGDFIVHFPGMFGKTQSLMESYYRKSNCPSLFYSSTQIT